MSQKKEFDDIFDDDFEVTYEEDPVYDEDDFDNGKFYETDDSDEDDSEENYFEEEYPGDEYPDEGAENEYDDAIYSPSDRKRKKRHPSEEEPEYETGKRNDPRSRKRSGVPLAAPIKKGGKALSRLTGFLLQQLSVLLILQLFLYYIISGVQAPLMATYRNRSGRKVFLRHWLPTCVLQRSSFSLNLSP